MFKNPWYPEAVVVAGLVASICSFAQGEHFKRGKDWMDLKNYSLAVEEFREAIREQPKNVEARYLIALCAFEIGNLSEAVEWLHETRRVAPGYPSLPILERKIRAKALQFLSSPQTVGIGLDAIAALPSLEAIDSLKKLLRSDNQNVRDKAEEVLRKIDPGKLREAWVAILDDSDARIREYGAERLWRLERNPKAIAPLRDKYLRIIAQANGWVGWSAEPVKALADLGWDQMFPALVELTDKYPDSPAANWVYNAIVSRREPRALPTIRRQVESSGVIQSGRWMWRSGAISCLGQIGERSDETLIKQALGRASSPHPAIGANTFALPEECLKALTSLSGDSRWSSLPANLEPFQHFLSALNSSMGRMVGPNDVISFYMSRPDLYGEIVNLMKDPAYLVDRLTWRLTAVEAPDRIHVVMDGLKTSTPVTTFDFVLRPKNKVAGQARFLAWEVVSVTRGYHEVTGEPGV